MKKSIFENLILFLKFKLASSSTENTLSLYKKNSVNQLHISKEFNTHFSLVKKLDAALAIKKLYLNRNGHVY